jgi:hypothetical protein
MHRSKALVYRMSSYFKTRRVRYQANLSTAWYNLHEKTVPLSTNRSIHRMIRSKYGKLKAYIIQSMNNARALLMKKHNRIRLNSRFGVHEEGTNITKRINLSDWFGNLIHRMISSKATQKPASTAWYPTLSRFIRTLASLNPQHVTT